MYVIFVYKSSLYNNNKRRKGLQIFDLKKERLKRELTQAEMANAIGVKYSSYVSWESGRAEPNFENKIKIGKFIMKEEK